MARIRASYSESHDYSKNPPRRGKRRASPPTPFVPGSPPDMNVGFLPKNLSEEQRRELRARQLAASQYDDPNMPLVHGPLPGDPDFDDSQNVTDPRIEGGYPNQFTGPIGAPPFPMVNGPQFTHTKTRTLLDREVHVPPPEFARAAASDVESALELIAAVSADDRDILAFDNKMSDAHMALRNLRQAGENMVRSVSRQDDRRGREDSVTAHARNLVRMLSTIIEPWFNVLEEEFDALLNETTQVKEMEREEV